MAVVQRAGSGSETEGHEPVSLQVLADAICRRGCDFCSISVPPDGTRNMTFEEVRTNIEYFDRGGGIRQVVLAGGEPTDRADLVQILELLGRVASLEDVVVVTRGDRWRKDESLLRAATALPLRVVFSFDLWTPSDLDPDRRYSVYGRARRVLDALGQHHIPATTNTVLTKSLVGLGEPAAAAVAALPTQGSTFTFPFPKGGVLANDLADVPTIDAARSWLLMADLCLLSQGRPWKLKGLPACFVPEFRQHITATPDRVYVSALHQTGAAERYLGDRLTLIYQPGCDRCTARPACDGFWARYLTTGQFPPLRPLR